MKAVFSRSGFTDGYLSEKRDRTMFGRRTKEDALDAAAAEKDAKRSIDRTMKSAGQKQRRDDD